MTFSIGPYFSRPNSSRAQTGPANVGPRGGPIQPAGGVGLPKNKTNRGDSVNYTHSGRLRTGLVFALGYLAVLWATHAGNDVFFGGLLSNYGIHPLDFNGIWGIVTAPLLHVDWEHLMGNSLPGAVFCFLIGLSGRKTWWEVTILVVLIGGLGTWLLGGPGSNHVGASSLVYGWLAYLLVRGIFNRSLSQFLLGVILGIAYSGLVWGVLPIYEGVSWQGHLFGAMGGIVAGMTITSDDTAKQIMRRGVN